MNNSKEVYLFRREVDKCLPGSKTRVDSEYFILKFHIRVLPIFNDKMWFSLVGPKNLEKLKLDPSIKLTQMH